MAARMIRMDYAYCMDEFLGAGQGFTFGALEGLAEAVKHWHRGLEEARRAGDLGFMELPRQSEEDLAPILAEADRLKELADTMVVLGIGGSALGATAVDMAMKGVMRYARAECSRGMRLMVADNSDPRFFQAILDSCDLDRTAFNVVSKSGSTAETMSQYLVVKKMLETRLGAQEARKRIVFTTDPEKGNLRKIQKDEPIATLSVPPNVGGRFSVLSAVGLLPLACAGHDVRALLAGAADMAQACASGDLMKNPAYLFAALAKGFADHGRNVLVMMPYASDLFGLAQWFGQLWAESLGKAQTLGGLPAHVGQTPVAAVGATDQHSQVQLYMEGPQDKLMCLLVPSDYGADFTIPGLYPDIEGLEYLGGQSMARLIQYEAQATAAALASQGRPSITLRLPAITEHVVGQVFYLLELATVMTGAMLDINPLDQPGVELGKKLTYGLMGRRGYEDEAKRVAEMDAGDRFTI